MKLYLGNKFFIRFYYIILELFCKAKFYLASPCRYAFLQLIKSLICDKIILTYSLLYAKIAIENNEECFYEAIY